MADTFEVRDNRKKEMFRVDDEYLNGYAKYLGTTVSMVYFVLCRHADRNQECFPSYQNIAEKLGTSDSTVKRAIKTLSEWNIISIGKQKRMQGKFLHNSYVLMDKSVWQSKPQVTGALPFTVGQIEPHRRSLVPSTVGHPRPIKVTHKKVTHKKDTDTSQSSVFSWKETSEKMMEKEGSDMDIIATFLTEKKISPITSTELTAYITRYRKTAKLITPFVERGFDKFWDAVKICQEESYRLGYDWNLETIYKKITKI